MHKRLLAHKTPHCGRKLEEPPNTRYNINILLVCLFVSSISQKLMDGFCEILWSGRLWLREQLVRFLVVYQIWIQIWDFSLHLTLRDRALAEVCILMSAL